MTDARPGRHAPGLPLRLVRIPLLVLLMAAPGLVAPLHASPREFVVAADGSSSVGFRIDDTIDTVVGSTKKVSGAILLDPAALNAPTVTMSVDLASLDTGIDMRDSEMRDTLGTKRFPVATFRSTGVVGPATLQPGVPADVRVAGDFTLHGVTLRIGVPVRITLTSDNRLRATSTFTIRMTDFGITVPDKLLVSVANEVEVRFDVIAVAK